MYYVANCDALPSEILGRLMRSSALLPALQRISHPRSTIIALKQAAKRIMSELPYKVPLFIDGKEVPSSNGKTFEVKNPYSGKVVSISQSASKADCNAAIESAAKAFKTWEKTTPSSRRAIFLKAADLIESDKYVSQLYSLSVGSNMFNSRNNA